MAHSSHKIFVEHIFFDLLKTRGKHHLFYWRWENSNNTRFHKHPLRFFFDPSGLVGAKAAVVLLSQVFGFFER